jgi:hypothetical protein
MAGSHQPGARLLELTGQGGGGRGTTTGVRATRRQWTGRDFRSLPDKGAPAWVGHRSSMDVGASALACQPDLTARRRSGWSSASGGCGQRAPPRAREELHRWPRVWSSAWVLCVKDPLVAEELTPAHRRRTSPALAELEEWGRGAWRRMEDGSSRGGR